MNISQVQLNALLPSIKSSILVFLSDFLVNFTLFALNTLNSFLFLLFWINYFVFVLEW